MKKESNISRCKRVLVALSLATVGLAFSAGAVSQTDMKTAVVENPPYSDVLKLAHRPEDLKLAYGDDPLQYALKWEPANGQPKANVIFVHGGCWLNAFDLNHARALPTKLSAMGYRVLSLEYRRTGDEGGGWPGTYQDVAAAVKRLTQSDDGLKTVIAGHSAGGHLALMTAHHHPELVDGVIGLAAITDVVAYGNGSNSCETATPGFMGGTPAEKPQAYQAATLTNKTFSVPVILLQGTADPIVPVLHAELAQATTKLVPGAGHFDWLHPQTPAFNALQDALSALSQSE